MIQELKCLIHLLNKEHLRIQIEFFSNVENNRFYLVPQVNNIQFLQLSDNVANTSETQDPTHTVTIVHSTDGFFKLN